MEELLRTLPGRQWPKDAPTGDRPARCDYCGFTYQRSKLRRDGSGLLVCPQDDNGPTDAVSITAANARAAASRTGLQGHVLDGAPITHQTDVAPTMASKMKDWKVPSGGNP